MRVPCSVIWLPDCPQGLTLHRAVMGAWEAEWGCTIAWGMTALEVTWQAEWIWLHGRIGSSEVAVPPMFAAHTVLGQSPSKSA